MDCSSPYVCTSSMANPIASRWWTGGRLWSKNDQPRSERKEGEGAIAVHRPENGDIFATGGRKDRSTSPSRSRSLFQSSVLPKMDLLAFFLPPRPHFEHVAGERPRESPHFFCQSINSFRPSSVPSIARSRAPLPSHYRVLYSPIVA